MIYYLAAYSHRENERALIYSPAGVAKMDYIIRLLSTIENKLTIISSCSTKKGKYKSQKCTIDEKVNVWYKSTFECNNLIAFYMERYLGVVEIMLYFFMNVKREDCVVVYHEVYYLPWVKILKNIIGFKLIYEIEELYGSYANNNKLIDKEIRYLRQGDSFIFTTKKLDEIINILNKPSMIVHGPYYINLNNEIIDGFNDNRIHCIYSGTLGKEKGGAYIAVDAAQYLDEKYCIHISGFGKERDVISICKYIDTIQNTSKCKIVFEGLLNEKEYDILLRKCSIGLATQKASGAYNSYCFQSKTIKYLSYGLTVVTAAIDVMKSSDVRGALRFYQSDNPRDVADAIMRASLNDKIENINLISELNIKAQMNIKKIVIGQSHK